MRCRLVQFLFVILALAAAPAPGVAGAWLRGEGDGFLSWTIKVQEGATARTYGTIYGEYGINPDLTIGVDLGSDEGGNHEALAFVLMPLSREDLHIAFELGAGTIEESAAIRPGISVGRGLDWGGLTGWWTIDTRLRVTQAGNSLAMDATLGINLKDETKLIGQLQEGGPLTDPNYLRLVGSLVWQLSPGRHIEVGLSTTLKNVEDFGLKLGMWRFF